MSTKKRVLINIGLTLCLFGLVALKLIRWHTHYTDFDIGSVLSELKAFTREPMYFFLIVPKYGIFLSAFFALVTILLPAKAKAMFGMIALRISVAMGILELGAYLFIHILVLLINKSFPYIGLDPLLTAGVLAVIYFAAATSDGYDIAKSKIKENKSQWLFFAQKNDVFLNGNERCYRRREIRDQKPTSGDNGINIEKFGKRLFAASVAAVVVPVLCMTLFISSNTVVWRTLFVCALIGGFGIFVGAALLIFIYIRNR